LLLATRRNKHGKQKKQGMGESFEKRIGRRHAGTENVVFGSVGCRAAPVLAHAFMLLAMPFLIHVKITGSVYICLHFLSLSLLGVL
jgi:hypothetical protein